MSRLIALILFAATCASAQTVTINWTGQEQQIVGFGAADQQGWDSNAPLTSAQAQLFFSQTNGIGLSIIREGTPEGPNSDGAQSGTGSCVTVGMNCLSPSSAMLLDMQAAMQQNPNLRVFATAFSPPADYKTNNDVVCTAGSGNGTLASGSYAAYATWLTNYVATLRSVYSIPLYALSVQNEPDLCPGYDGSLFTGSNLLTFVPQLASAMSSAGQSATLLVIPESSTQSQLTNLAGACMGNGGCSPSVGVIATHNYDSPSFGTANTNPYGGTQYWMSEISGTVATPTSASYPNPGGPYTGAMYPDALYWAYNIWSWMVQGNANAWLFWAMIPYSSPYPNTGLLASDGATQPQRLWAVGNYSKFIQPGYYRIDATSTPQSGVYVSAFQNTSSGNLVVVAINDNGSTTNQTFCVSNGPTFATAVPYVTSGFGQSLQPQGAVSLTGNCLNSYPLVAQSVTTFVATASAPPPSGTYYVSFTHGSDSNNGTSKTTPCQYAPGMYGSSGACSAISLSAGNQVIFEGCVTWPNSAFPWVPKFSGTSGNNIYYGVDTTWWDNTVPGCGSAWNRPIFNPGGTPMYKPGGPDSFDEMIDVGGQSYQTFDNFEITGVYAYPGPTNGLTTIFDFGYTNPGDIVQNMYVHGWINPYISVGTGNVSGGTISNYVPFSYATKQPNASWVQSNVNNSPLANVIGAGGMTCGGNGCVITSVSSGPPYTIVAEGSGGSCTGCTIQIGGDYLNITAGETGADNGSMMYANYIDGSDVAEVLWNPYPDCGATEGNNNVCMSGGGASPQHIPNIWRDNFIQYTSSGFVGQCQEISGNLIQYLRLGPNISSHTNGVECLSENPLNNAMAMFGNVFRHWNQPNPNLPGGVQAIGLGVAFSAPASTVFYTWGNIAYDTLNNAWLGPAGYGYGCGSSPPVANECGNIVIFNNSSDGGYQYEGFNEPPTSPCNLSFTNCLYQNNYWVTNVSSQWGGPCGSNCTVPAGSELLQTVASAIGFGNSESQTPYVWAPTSGTSPQVGTGTSNTTICAAINAASTFWGTACGLDTPYAVTPNTTNHTVTIPARTQLSLSSPSVPRGAYQFSSSGTAVFAPPNPSSLTFGNVIVGQTTAAQTITVTNNGTITLTGLTVALNTGTQFSQTNTCTSTLAGGASCTVSVKAAPTSVGNKTDQVELTSTNATNSPQAVAVSATGYNPTGIVQVAASPCGVQTFSTTTCNYGATTVAGQVGVFGFNGNNSQTGTITSITDNAPGGSSQYFAVAGATSNNGALTISQVWWGITNPGATTYTVTMSVPTSGSGVMAQVTNVNSVGTPCVLNSQPASSTPTGCPLTVGAPTAQYLFSLTDIQGIGFSGITAPWTLTSLSNGNLWGYLVTSAAGTYSMSGMATSGTFNNSTVPFYQAASAPNAVPSPTTLAFGSVTVGNTSSPMTVTLSNTNGTAPLTVTSVVPSSQYAVSSQTCTTTPVAINASCSASVTFSPVATGSQPGTLTFTDNASTSPQVVALSGSGTSTPTPGVQLAPASLTFPNTRLGASSATQTIVLTNTGTATLGSIVITTSGQYSKTTTCGATLAMMTSCNIVVTFSPTSLGAQSGSVTVTSNASSSPNTAGLSGTGVASVAVLSPTSLSFPNQPITTTSGALTVTVSNTGGTATLSVTAETFMTGTQFAITGDTCISTPVAIGASCSFGVTFTPTTLGLKTDTLTLTTNVPSSPTIAISGTGTSQPMPGVGLNPTGLSFGTVFTNGSSVQQITLTNTGNANLTFASGAITISDTTDFSESDTCVSSSPIAANGTCLITITFHPPTIGYKTTSITIVSNSESSPNSATASGTGVSPPPSTGGPAAPNGSIPVP